MEVSELLFSVVDTLSEPVLLLEKSEEGKWLHCYDNQLMEKLLKVTSDTKTEDTTKSDANIPLKMELDSSLQILLERYAVEGISNHHTISDIEIFNSIYNINFYKNEKYLLLIFAEIKDAEIFNNITFHDFSGVCSAIVVILDSMGKVFDMNECFLNISGMEKKEILGKGFFETFIPGDIEKLGSYFANILKEDVYHQQFLTPFKGKREELYRINWQVSKIIRHDQIYIIAVGSDISKFVEENNTLKQKLASIKIGFEHFPFATGYMNEKGIFVNMNVRFMKMFNISEADTKIAFDQIALFKKYIGFEKMNEHIKLIKEMSYKIDFLLKGKPVKLKVDIRLLSGSKESSKFYIVVAQKIV
ncbi:PAS domain S-box-containing protein [Epsilonproteobacteria bacterium SCGC AD-308-P11]|jgi:PAS domain S-box-containing protein|nr:PAS domain S-box-containing protein [Epsilonproteobacteria bacterium SCGC AD-308-O04]SMP89125.1 PAS domain S-box-containing protein [Epsilonproteobacteria bacterium SCGC AD-308-P11]